MPLFGPSSDFLPSTSPNLRVLQKQRKSIYSQITAEKLLSKSSLPPLSALRAFGAAGRHLNFQLAAEELHVTQGAAAQHVRSLEKYLDVSRFDRRPKGVVLTQVGYEYHANVAEAFDALCQATDQVGTALVIGAAIAGQEVALASRFLDEEDLRAGRLIQISEVALEEPVAFFLLARRNRKRTPHVDLVISWGLADASAAEIR